MKHIFSTILLLSLAYISFAQEPETVTGRVELNDGRFVIESFTIKMVGDSIQL